jgi:hypothetical protein
LIQLDAFGLQLFHERGMILHIKADVVQYTAARGRLLCVGLPVAELHSRQVHDEIVTSLAWLSAKGLHIPGLRFGNFALLQEKMNVFVADRDLLVREA